MEVNIDDMLVKSVWVDEHLTHLKEALKVLLKYNMKLNPEKWAFGVGSGNFLGFLILNRVIEANHVQIKEIESILEVLKSQKVVMRLSERIAELEWFISRYSKRCHKIFAALKRTRTSNGLMNVDKRYETWKGTCPTCLFCRNPNCENNSWSTWQWQKLMQVLFWSEKWR